MAEKDKTARKEFASAPVLKRIMADHFLELDNASGSGGRKIAWCTSVGPAELLRALGFLVYFPENHGAMLGATRMASEMIPHANAAGYSPDICSYLTSDIGSYLRGNTPLTRAYGIASVPAPDVLVFNTNQCRDVQDWFRWYGRRLDVPVLGVYSHRGIGPVESHHIRDITAQLKAMVPELEKISGRRMDPDRLRRTVEMSLRTSVLWRECLERAAVSPSPWTFFDATIHMGPAVIARGTGQAVEYYELLLAELDRRVLDGVQSVGRERHRLYWEGMPIWGKLKALSELFSALDTCIVASTYCNSWIFDGLDPDQPLESMARVYTELFIVRDESYKESYIEACRDRYGFHGIIFHESKTCPNNSNNRYGMPGRLTSRLGVPCLTIHGDLCDLRCYSEEQTRTNIEAFIEQLEGN